MELLEKPLQTGELENSGFKCGTENMLTTESLENDALIIIIVIIIIIIIIIIVMIMIMIIIIVIIIIIIINIIKNN